MEILLGLGFPSRDEARWMRSLAETLLRLGDSAAARAFIAEALRKDPALPNVKRLRKELVL
jgi:hypothetical protein